MGCDQVQRSKPLDKLVKLILRRFQLLPLILNVIRHLLEGVRWVVVSSKLLLLRSGWNSEASIEWWGNCVTSWGEWSSQGDGLGCRERSVIMTPCWCCEGDIIGGVVFLIGFCCIVGFFLLKSGLERPCYLALPCLNSIACYSLNHCAILFLEMYNTN